MIDQLRPSNIQVAREPASVTKARQRSLRLSGTGSLLFADAVDSRCCEQSWSPLCARVRASTDPND